jgi:hypothetical protein
MSDDQSSKSPNKAVKKALALSFIGGLVALVARLVRDRKHRDQSSDS